MNCPFCKKPLPKGNPRTCPNCKKDLTSFYKMKAKQGEEIRMDQKKPLPIALIAILACCLIGGAVLLILSMTGDKKPEGTPTSSAIQTEAPGKETAAPGSEAASVLDMSAVKAEINSRQVSDFEESAEPTDYVKLTVKDFGEIVVRIRPDVAPISAQNFKDLVARHYYDGTAFHRVYPGFMIQGGAGEEELPPIKGEFSANGVENPLLHVRGVLSMARTKVMDSATSQFFLMHADNDTLDGNYAAFGYIVAGLETVDKICEIDLDYNPYSGEKSVPQVEVIIESAVFVTPKQ